ncbi:hypothetical protein HBI05_204640 [Parastagonospora nodorum]|nr:hypothetical protein HBI05_204640 [Parastagonospora nodorum]
MFLADSTDSLAFRLINGLPKPATLTTPAAALPTGVLGSGTVSDKVYNYTFFASGIVQINNSFLQPKRGILSGFLPDRLLCGLFSDGLHIGRHIVPYPTAYVQVIIGINLSPPPAGLGSSLDDGGL